MRVGWRCEADIECVAERHSWAGFLWLGGLVGGLVGLRRGGVELICSVCEGRRKRLAIMLAACAGNGQVDTGVDFRMNTRVNFR